MTIRKFTLAGLLMSSLLASACGRPQVAAPEIIPPPPPRPDGLVKNSQNPEDLLRDGLASARPAQLQQPSEPFEAAAKTTVFFPEDQSTLNPEARAALASQVGWLNRNTGFSAVIQGHADEKGTREYNLALGARRANSVQEYLIAHGVSATRLRTLTYGRERPVSECGDTSCASANRRAVTIVTASQAGV